MIVPWYASQGKDFWDLIKILTKSTNETTFIKKEKSTRVLLQNEIAGKVLGPT